MRIGIDAREIQDGVVTGIGRALSVFLDFFSGRTDEHCCVLFSAKPLSGDITSGQRVTSVVVPEKQTLFWDQYILPALARRHRIDVLYSPYYKIPLLCPCPCISTMYDLMYLTCDLYKKQLSPFSRLYYRTMGTLMAHRAALICTCSHYSQSEIRSWYHVDARCIKTIYLGLDECYCPVLDTSRINDMKRRFAIPGDYLLYAGNFKPHKNVGRLLEAFSLVRAHRPELHLVLAGTLTPHFDVLRDRIDSLGIGNVLITPGRVSTFDQVALYSAARAVIMPSLYEGFGYPPLEAMACGTPVVSSNRTSLPEVVGDAGLLIDPENTAEMAGAVNAILESESLARDLVQRGFEQAGRFRRERFAAELYECIIGCARR